MNALNDDATRIIRIMSRDMHFIVSHKNVLRNPEKTSTDIIIRIDADKEKFYYDFFMNNYRQMQMLMALGDDVGAGYLYIKLKDDLSRIVEKASSTSRHIVFTIPYLEKCLEANATV